MSINTGSINRAPINGAGGGGRVILELQWIGADFWQASGPWSITPLVPSGGNIIVAPAKQTSVRVCEKHTAMAVPCLSRTMIVPAEACRYRPSQDMRVPCLNRTMSVARNPLADMKVPATTEGCDE